MSEALTRGSSSDGATGTAIFDTCKIAKENTECVKEQKQLTSEIKFIRGKGCRQILPIMGLINFL